jgi:hypothetical protein
MMFGIGAFNGGADMAMMFMLSSSVNAIVGAKHLPASTT